MQESEGEVLADCGAYLATHSHYGDSDRFLQERLDLTREFFAHIKNQDLKIVDGQEYTRRHILGEK